MFKERTACTILFFNAGFDVHLASLYFEPSARLTPTASMRQIAIITMIITTTTTMIISIIIGIRITTTTTMIAIATVVRTDDPTLYYKTLALSSLAQDFMFCLIGLLFLVCCGF